MPRSISVDQAAHTLEQLVDGLGPNDEILLTRNNLPVAKITSSRPPGRRQAGTCKGMLIIHQEDDEHLADFKDYMP